MAWGTIVREAAEGSKGENGLESYSGHRWPPCFSGSSDVTTAVFTVA